MRRSRCLLCCRFFGIVLLVAGWTAEVKAGEPGLLACYRFDQGSGEIVQDQSGNGHHGKLHNATWVKETHEAELAFADADSYVDCGMELARKLTGDMTAMAWVKLKAAPYPDNTTNWTLLDCEDYAHSGFVVRIDGQSAKLYYRASSPGHVPESFSVACVENDTYHHLAVSRRGTQVCLYLDGRPEVPFSADRPAQPSTSLKISSPGQTFRGRIKELAIYNRGLAREEILAAYQKDAARHGKDTSWFGTFQLEPFLYLEHSKAAVRVDFLGVLPLPKGSRITMELGEADHAALKATPVNAIPESGKQDFDFDLASLPAGRYEIRAVLRDAGGKAIASRGVTFAYPPSPAAVPNPAAKVLPPLPAAAEMPRFEAEVGRDGGLTVQTGRRGYSVSAEFSYPGGGLNRLGQAAGSEGPQETAWKPTTRQLGPSRYEVTANGQHYALRRRIEIQPSRVLVQDTITNRTDEPLGVMVRNHLSIASGTSANWYVGGYRSGKSLTAKAIKTNPTIFVSSQGQGVGLVALDDVFIVQSQATLQGECATLHSDTFALAGRASYTLEWAIYPTPSEDYYDFINQVRRDEGRNGTVDGTVGFVTRGPADRRSVPDQESLKLRNLKYLLIHCLSYAADDPGVSIEGIEFSEYPKECQLLKEQFAAIHRASPGIKVAFHVAHSLYATDQPERHFADSRVIDANGRHAVYTTNPGSYFSPERRKEGWNWYIYYPTPENSFGRAMLASVDVMMDQIGADGPFLDGFMWAYGGEYTYDRWDGHTAQIDPKSKKIVRTMGSVLLLSQGALVAYCRKIHDKGGVIIANNSVITRTIARENYLLHDRECYAGPEVHLAPTPMALSLPSAIRSEPDVYRDVLDKLQWGNLYAYYEEGRLSHPSVPARMFPMTLEEIHSGCVKGRQRLVTVHSGLYGWPGDRDLHFAWLYDGRGVNVSHGFMSTVDRQGVRTQVELGRQQCAVVRKIPVQLQCSEPMNLRVEQYDEQAIVVHLNGTGAATFAIRSGDFGVRPGARYDVAMDGGHEKVVAGADGNLAVNVELRGALKIRITASTP